MLSPFVSINQYVNKCAIFSEEEIHIFNDLLQVKTVKKKTILLREGEVCNFEAYILKGCIRTFCMDENGV